MTNSSWRSTSEPFVERLVACTTPQRAPRRANDREFLLVMNGPASPALPNAIALDAAPDAFLDGDQVTELHHWLAGQAAGLALHQRASVLGLLPQVVSWVAVQRQIAWQLDRTLNRLRPQHLLAWDLPQSQQALLAAYAGRTSLPFETRATRAPRSRLRATSLHLHRATLAMGSRLRSARMSTVAAAQRPRLLVVSLQPNSTRSFLPVAQSLRVLGCTPHFLLQASDLRSVEHVRAEGFPWMVVERESRWSDAPAAYLSAESFLRRAGANGFAEVLDVAELPSWAPRDLLARSLSRTLRPHLQASCYQTPPIARSLRRIDPVGAVFITNRAMMNELLAERRARTKRIFFLQGVVPEIPPIFSPLDVDLALVGSALDLPYTKRCRIPDPFVVTTGYPEYDQRRRLDRPTCRRDLETLVPRIQGRPLILFTSQYVTEVFPDWARRRNIEILIEAAHRLPTALFLLKPHPLRETVDDDLRKLFPPNLAECPPCDVALAITAADVAVTYWSTTALEALLLATPLVQLNGTGLPDFFDISTRLRRPIARTPDDLVALLTPLLSSAEARADFGRARDRFLRDHRIALDGGAAERAAQEILKVV